MARASPESIQDLVAQAYEAALAPELWATVLDGLVSATSSDHAILHLAMNEAGEAEGRRVCTGQVAGALALWEEHFLEVDPYIPRVLETAAQRLGKVVEDDELVPRAELRRGEFYNDFWADQVSHGVGVVLSLEPHWNNLNLMRLPGRQPYDPTEVELLQALCPHLQRAVEIDRRVRFAEARVGLHERALDALSNGAALLDARGRVLYMNAALEEVVRRGDGLVVREGRLHARSATRGAPIHEMLRSGSEPFDGSVGSPIGQVRIDRASGKLPLFVSLVPVRGDLSRHPVVEAGSVLFVQDPEKSPRIESRRLEVVYGLTTAEARVSVLLSQGLSLEEIADRRGVKIGSVRSQLKAVFSKTGAHSQAELVSVVLRGRSVADTGRTPRE